PDQYTSPRCRPIPSPGPPSPGVVGAHSPLEEAMREADLPAEQPEAQEEARIPDPDAHARRAGRAEDAPRPRARTSLGLILRVRDRATFALLARARVSRCDPVWVRRVAVGGPGPQVAYA